MFWMKKEVTNANTIEQSQRELQASVEQALAQTRRSIFEAELDREDLECELECKAAELEALGKREERLALQLREMADRRKPEVEVVEPTAIVAKWPHP